MIKDPKKVKVSLFLLILILVVALIIIIMLSSMILNNSPKLIESSGLINNTSIVSNQLSSPEQALINNMNATSKSIGSHLAQGYSELKPGDLFIANTSKDYEGTLSNVELPSSP